jgi:Spy/CpxP family protein refolding chaperone
MFGWWKHRHAQGACGGGEGASAWAGHCGPGGGGGGPQGWRFAGPGHHGGGDDGEFGGGAFGVRRPLRFLAYKLELSEEQVEELARILNDLKTERAQAAVDNRRTTSAFADAIAGETFDTEKVSAAAGDRVKSAERLRDAVATALGKIHALLDPQQRAKLAYLIRTGALTI